MKPASLGPEQAYHYDGFFGNGFITDYVVTLLAASCFF